MHPKIQSSDLDCCNISESLRLFCIWNCRYILCINRSSATRFRSQGRTLGNLFPECCFCSIIVNESGENCLDGQTRFTSERNLIERGAFPFHNNVPTLRFISRIRYKRYLISRPIAFTPTHNAYRCFNLYSSGRLPVPSLANHLLKKRWYAQSFRLYPREIKIIGIKVSRMREEKN